VARRPAHCAPCDAGPDDDEYLLRRRGHEDGIHHIVLDRAPRRGRLALARIETQSGWLKRVSGGASGGSSVAGLVEVTGRFAAAAFSRSRREIGCGTQGRSPRLSLAPTTVTRSVSSQNPLPPPRQE